MSYPAFPALAPVSRSYLMGDHPSARKVAMNGAMFNVLFADRKTSDTLTLTFRGTQKDALEILNHYEKVDGTYGVFFARHGPSAGIFSGGFSADLIDADEGGKGKYRYANPPRVAQIHKNLFEVQVELVQTYAQSPE